MRRSLRLALALALLTPATLFAVIPALCPDVVTIVTQHGAVTWHAVGTPHTCIDCEVAFGFPQQGTEICETFPARRYMNDLGAQRVWNCASERWYPEAL